MNLKYNKINITTASNCIAFVLLTILFLGISLPEILAQGTNTMNATNATTASGSEGSPVTVVMPAGSAAATGGGGYEPDPVTVSPGSNIIWDNQDNALHTATSGDPQTAVLDDKFDTGYVMANQQSNPIPMPTEPGEYTYFCTLHPFLTGTVVVQ
ncbi:MAG: cupredoxin domain-containing protein [Nitrososphaeraceae archaeon]